MAKKSKKKAKKTAGRKMAKARKPKKMMARAKKAAKKPARKAPRKAAPKRASKPQMAPAQLTLPMETAVVLTEGMPAPDFRFKAYPEGGYCLSDLRGRKVVLFFYPKDDTPGCTAEAQSFRDHYSEFQILDTVVLGVSFDSQESHQKFQEKHELPFPLLVDADKKIARAYGVKGTLFADRDVIVIDGKGKVAKIIRSVDPDDIVAILLKDAK